MPVPRKRLSLARGMHIPAHALAVARTGKDARATCARLFLLWHGMLPMLSRLRARERMPVPRVRASLSWHGHPMLASLTLVQA